jgi:hypothetical protein
LGAGVYTIVGSLPRGSSNHTVLALKEDGNERQGVVLRPLVPGVEPVMPPRLPGLVPLLGFDEVEGSNYALYEFSPGVTLREILEAFKATQRRAPLGLAGRIVLDAARVVSALHTGPQVVHGALQDGALLVSFDGITRLIDVGSGRRSRYDAPEVERGEGATTKSDIYALAAMMHAAATGYVAAYAPVPVRAATSADLPPPSKHHADAPPELDSCLFRALITNPTARVASARQFGDELEKALTGKLYTREQVGATLSELFGDRVAALKSLVARAAQDTEPPKNPRPSRPRPPQAEVPTGPRPSAPRPRASAPRPAPAPEMVPGTNIPAGTQPGQGGGIILEEQIVLVEAEEEDKHMTKPQRPRASAPPPARRSSKPNNPAVSRPGPPVPSQENLAPVPLEDDAPATGVEPVFVPPAARVEATDAGPAYVPPPPVEEVVDEGPAAISIGNDAEGDAAALGDDDGPATAIRPRPQPRASAPRLSNPAMLKQQTEEEKAAAAGQEKIETGDIDPENLGELAQLQDEVPLGDAPVEVTNVKARPQAPEGYVPDDEDGGTITKRPQKKKGGGLGRVFLVFILLLGAVGGAGWKLRPWRGKPLPAWVPPELAKLAIADGAIDPNAPPKMQVVQITQAQVAPQAPEAATDAGVVAANTGTPAAVVTPPVAGADAGEEPADAGSGGAAAAIAEAKAVDAGSVEKEKPGKAEAPPPVVKKKPKKKKTTPSLDW